MRKIISFGLALFLLMAFGRLTMAVDTNGYLENRLRVLDGEDLTASNKLRLDFAMKQDSYYFLVSLLGINTIPGPPSVPFQQVAPDNNLLKINRAYLDIYPSWGKFTVGLQNIAWGNGYLFNIADQFNTINPVDPKGEKAGINAISAKWNLSGTSLLETVVLPAAKAADCDLGIKGQFTLGLFDFAGYFIRRVDPANPPVPLAERRLNMIEVKGQISPDLPGIWAQAGWFTDIPAATGSEKEYTSYVFGSDYTIPIGNGLYIIAEYLQNGQTGHDQLYVMSRYSPEGYLTLAASGLQDLANNAAMINFNIRYILNDNIEIFGMYNYYSQGSQILGLPYNCNNNEIVLAVKTSF